MLSHQGSAEPACIEAVLLTTLVFAGVNVAWLLLFEEAPADQAALAQRAGTRPASLPRHSSVSQDKPGKGNQHT